ncbi:MAG: hypothetical protein ACWA5L_11470 [bacterium]
MRKSSFLFIATVSALSLFACETGLGERDQYIQMRAVKERAGDDEAAFQQLRDIAQNSTDNGVRREAFETLGRVALKQGNEDAAAHYLKQAIALGSYKAAFYLAEFRLDSKDKDYIISTLKDVAIERPEKGYDIAELLTGYIPVTEIALLQQKAEFELQRRALRGETTALRDLAKRDLESGNTSTRASLSPQALQQLRLAAQKGDTSSLSLLSNYLIESGQEREGEDLLVQAERKNYPFAKRALAKLYAQQGKTEPEKLYQAALRYEQVAKEEARTEYYLRAANLYADYAKKTNTASGMNDARRLWTLSGELGLEEGYYKLATSYPETDIEARKAAFLQAASTGHVSASRKLGRLLFENAQSDADIVQTQYWLQKAADQGDPAAQYSLAKIYDQKGLAEDLKMARALFRQSYQGGYTSSAKYLARYEALGIAGTASHSRARQFLENLDSDKAAIEAFKFGREYAKGAYVERDRALALRWFETAQSFNQQAVTERIVKSIYKNSDLFDKQTRLAWQERLAANGQDIAYFVEKEAVFERQRQKQFKSPAARPSQKSIKHSRKKTTDYLDYILLGDAAQMSQRGQEVAGELADAEDYEMMHKVGLRLVSNSDRNASSYGTQLLLKAANADYPESAFWVADARMAGIMTEQISVADTNRYYEIAATGDLAAAQYITGMRYLEGSFGQKQNSDRALYWLELAKRNGDLRAADKIQQLQNN